MSSFGPKYVLTGKGPVRIHNSAEMIAAVNKYGMPPKDPAARKEVEKLPTINWKDVENTIKKTTGGSSSQTTAKTSPAGQNSSSEVPEEGGGKKFIVILIVVIVLSIIGYFIWKKFHKSK